MKHKKRKNQLDDDSVYNEVNYDKTILCQLFDTNNKYFKKLNSKGYK